MKSQQSDWERYRVAHRRAQLVYEDPERAFTQRSKSLWTNAPNPRNWWFSVKTAVFGASLNFPPLIDREVSWCGLQMRTPRFLAHLEANQCRDSFQQPHSCDSPPVLQSVAFWSSFVRSLLLNSYGGNDPDEMFPLFYKQVARELTPKLAVIFRHLGKGSFFPACWR